MENLCKSGLFLYEYPRYHFHCLDYPCLIIFINRVFHRLSTQLYSHHYDFNNGH